MIGRYKKTLQKSSAILKILFLSHFQIYSRYNLAAKSSKSCLVDPFSTRVAHTLSPQYKYSSDK